jgi:hypothetical protein
LSFLAMLLWNKSMCLLPDDRYIYWHIW